MSFISARSRRDLREITKLTEFLARSRLSRRNLFHVARVSARSRQYLARDRFHLVPISETLQITPGSWRDLIYLAATLETLQISPRYWRDLGEISIISPPSQRNYKSRRVLVEILFISTRSLSSRWDLVAISEKLQSSPSSWRDLVYLEEISFMSRESRRDLVSILPEIAFISCRSQRHYKSRRVLDEISFISPRP